MAEIEELIPDATAKALADFAYQKPRELEVWQSSSGCLMVPVEWCEPDPDVRERTTETDQIDLQFYQGIAELAARKPEPGGLEGSGVESPILLRVSPADPTRFKIKDGRRRWNGVKYAHGIFVPAVIDGANDAESFEITLRANIANRAYTPVEEGNGFLILQGLGDSVAVIAGKMGVSDGFVNNRLRAANKPPDIKAMVQAASTKTRSVMAHADEIDKVTDPVERERLAAMVVKDKASLDTIKEEVKELDRRGKVKPKPTIGRSAPRNGSIGNKTKPATVYVDWKGLDKAGRDAAFNILRNVRDHKPKTKENRDLMINAIAGMKKDLNAALEMLGSDID